MPGPLDLNVTVLPSSATAGDFVTLQCEVTHPEHWDFAWDVTPPPPIPGIEHTISDQHEQTALWYTRNDLIGGIYEVTVRLTPRPGVAPARAEPGFKTELVTITRPAPGSPGTAFPVSLTRTNQVPTSDQILWVVVRNRTNAIGFNRYAAFVDSVMCGTQNQNAPFRGPDAYDVLKYVTNLFLMHETGTIPFNPPGWTVPTEAGVHGNASLDPTVAITELDGRLHSPDRGAALLNDELGRLGFTLTPSQLQAMRNSYYEALTTESHDREVLPYLEGIRRRLQDLPLKGDGETPPNCYGILRSELTGPLAIELIWSYWQEEGMLAQTLNAILARFQNRRLAPGPDALARFDLEPLRPLNNLLWGWTSDELRRLTVRRRAYEYDHEYGLTLYGKAVGRPRTSDSRSKFLEAFHNLLFLCAQFFKEDDDTTVIADGFPVLNALREVHLLLAEGAHNQFGDLPSVARAEMLIMQWLLARPEMRMFLGGRVMVPYEEPWMDRVDMMKQMQGWTDVTITHFRDMAVYGEQILLTVRYGNWNTVTNPQQAANWARYWRPEIQRYTHAYRAATGVDLIDLVDTAARAAAAIPPSALLRRRLAAQHYE